MFKEMTLNKLKESYIEEPVYCDKYQIVCKESNNTNYSLKEIKNIINKIKNKANSDKKEPVGNQNCMLCTWCLEAQFRGINILPRPVYSPRDVIFNLDGYSIVNDPNKINIRNKNNVINIVQKAKNGARFYTHINWKGSNGGHEFIVMNIDDKVYIIDAQSGTLADINSKDGSYYFKNINYNNSFLIRLDDKEFNTDILKYNNNSYILDWDEDVDIKYLENIKESYITESKDKSEYSSSFKKKIGGSFKYIKFPSSEAERYMKKDIHWDKQSIDFFKDTKVGELIIDKEKDVIAGYIFVHKLKGVIGPLRIYDEYRGYGLSNTLVQDAINKFNGRELGVYTDNEVAVNLYHKHGFTNSETKKEKNGDEYMIMKLNESYIEEVTREDISSKFLEKNDTVGNVENWQPYGHNILYITGLSGSGKTTLAIDLMKEFNCYRVELDCISIPFFTKARQKPGRVERAYKDLDKECPGVSIWCKKNYNKYEIENWSQCIPLTTDFLSWFISTHEGDGNLYIINGAQIPDIFDPEFFKERPIIVKESNTLKSVIRRTGRESKDEETLTKAFKQFVRNLKFITRPSYVQAGKDMRNYAKSIKNKSFEKVDSHIMKEDYIEEASSMDKKYRCPYCDNLYKRKDLPSHIEDKHEELIPKEMTPLQITFNAVNNKTRGTCTECRGESPWNESKGRYDRICTKKSCHDSYVKKMKSRMVNKYGREHNLNDVKVQEKMLKNRKISGTYIWSDRTQFSYCGSYEKALLEFLDKVLNCKSEDIMTPGPIIDYTYKGEKHQWIMDLYYIPYNLCFDVKDGGKNPNNRPMEEYREKQDAKERAIKDQGKYNYIRLTDNDFSQLFEIFFELKMQLIENDTNKIVRINEYSSATINALPVMGQEKGDYIIQYMSKNTFTTGYGYCCSNELIDDIHIIDTYGKENIVQRDEFLNMIEEYTIFKYNGIVMEDSNEYDNSYPIDYYYTKLTGRRITDDRQIFIDKDFSIESKLEDKLNALKEVYTSSLLDNTILENDIGFDKDGIYKYNENTGLRTKSYDSLEKINKDEIKIIESL